jgi:hypothetical protein
MADQYVHVNLIGAIAIVIAVSTLVDLTVCTGIELSSMSRLIPQ